MLMVDCGQEFLQLSKHALEFILSEEEIFMRFLLGLHDEMRVQLVSHNLKEFFDLTECVKMADQAMGLDKKTEPS